MLLRTFSFCFAAGAAAVDFTRLSLTKHVQVLYTYAVDCMLFLRLIKTSSHLNCIRVCMCVYAKLPRREIIYVHENEKAYERIYATFYMHQSKSSRTHIMCNDT